MPSLDSLESLRDYVHHLGAKQHDTTGNWSVGQIYFHLAAAFEGSVEGLPAGYSPLMRFAARSMRWVVTRIRFPPWLPIPAAIAFKLQPPAEVDIVQQHQRLVRAIECFAQHEGDLPAHPVLGKLSRKEWTGFHLRHCKHHLGFITPAK